VRVVPTLGRIISAVAKSAWFWPLALLVGLSAVGEWVSATAAVIAAAACAAVGIGIAIGLTIAGERAGASHTARSALETDPPARRSAVMPSAGGQGGDYSQKLPRTADLRGALLVNALLVRADLRQADLRGATLMGADLSGADLSGAQLGPLDDSSNPSESA
jgi:hypothetical protein